MKIQEKLKNLILNEVIPDIEEYLDELFEIVASKKDDKELKNEILDMQDMKKEFEELLKDIESGDIEDDEAKELIDEIIEMKSIEN